MSHRRTVFPIRSMALLAASLLAACGGGKVPLPRLSTSTAGDTAGLVARGEYLVRNVSVCGHCHAADPRNPDGPLAGGLPFRNWRLGTIFAANLTPDQATGIGSWSEAEIVRAIRNGQDREGHLLAPVMPYEWLSGLSDRDALAMAAYLKTQPPVSRRMHNRPDLVFNVAKALILRPARTGAGPAAPRGPTAEYGRYLADHVGLCADCHTPRGGLQQAPDKHKLYAGDATPPSAFPANPSNLTPDAETGIGRWTEEDFLRTLRTGVNPDGDRLHPFMPWREYRRMTDDDLRAIYRYLRTLQPIRNPVPRRPSPPPPAG
ncbi:c-type cytochrome [Longimicrobium sp.]|uniref:c-type cytochrome n=1 Tax=Longimicrobium sp. TaxID=2029185 RepID=UPI002BCBA791|nr:c-type cytochrome [Longimicrobium sp.]HSU13643.1 c-type cytochrome [Longimicrobium sp.]